MKFLPFAAFATLGLNVFAADTLTTRNPNPSAPAATAGAAFDAAKELPRFRPVEPAAALATWKVKPASSSSWPPTSRRSATPSRSPSTKTAACLSAR